MTNNPQTKPHVSCKCMPFISRLLYSYDSPIPNNCTLKREKMKRQTFVSRFRRTPCSASRSINPEVSRSFWGQLLLPPLPYSRAM